MDGSRLPLNNKAGDFTGNTADGAVQSADSGVVSKRADDHRPKVRVDRKSSRFEPGVGSRFGEQITLGDLDLFGVGVAWHLDGFKTVYHGSGDIAGIVSGGDEENFGKVNRVVDKVINETIILVRVEKLDQNAHDVRPCLLGDTVNFIKKDDRILHLNLTQSLDDLTRFGF